MDFIQLYKVLITYRSCTYVRLRSPLKTSTIFSQTVKVLGANMNLSVHCAGPPGPKGPVGPPGPSGQNVSSLTAWCYPPVTY